MSWKNMPPRLPNLMFGVYREWSTHSRIFFFEFISSIKSAFWRKSVHSENRFRGIKYEWKSSSSVVEDDNRNICDLSMIFWVQYLCLVHLFESSHPKAKAAAERRSEKPVSYFSFRVCSHFASPFVYLWLSTRVIDFNWRGAYTFVYRL